MNININEKLLGTLERLAEVRSMTPEVYVEEYLDNHLTSQYKAELVDKVESESVENIAEISEVIDVKKAEIKAEYDLANPVIVREVVNQPVSVEVSTTTEEVIN